MDMMKRRGTGIGVLALALGLSVSPARAQQAETFRLDGPRVVVYNLAGEVEVVRGSGSDVVVEVLRRGSDGNLLEVAVDDIRGRTALRVLYPEDRIVYPAMGRGSNTNQRVRSDGTFGDSGSNRGDRYEIRGSGSGLEAYADLRIEVPPGRSLEVFVAAGRAWAQGVEGDLSIDTGSGAVEAVSIRGELNIDTGSGSVTVEDVVGTTVVDTGSGSVSIDDVDGDEILVDTGSGHVEGSNLRARSVNVDTGSGGITLGRVDSPDVYLDTGSGSIEVELLSDVQRLEIDTGSGSVTVYVPEDLGAEVEIETGSGAIDLDFPVQLRTMRRNEIEGSIGDGRGSIRIDTGSGGVRLIRP